MTPGNLPNTHAIGLFWLDDFEFDGEGQIVKAWDYSGRELDSSEIEELNDNFADEVLAAYDSYCEWRDEAILLD